MVFPSSPPTSVTIKDVARAVAKIKAMRKIPCVLLGKPRLKLDHLIFRLCSPATCNEPGLSCDYCGIRLNCANCEERVKCLGEHSIRFCSRDCSDNWQEYEMVKRKMRTYLWKHPFKSIAILGALLTTSCSFIAAFQYLELMPALIISGVLVMLTAALLHWINIMKSN